MKPPIRILFLLLLFSCSNNPSNSQTSMNEIKNETIKKHAFLDEMYSDTFFPKFLVDKCKDILLDLCAKIEAQNPKSLEELYKLTHAATIEINHLGEEFYEHESEIETAARESIAEDFEFIAKTYGFPNADVEELIAPREW